MTTPQMDWLDDQRRKRAVSSDDIVTRLRAHLVRAIRAAPPTSRTHWDGCVDSHPICALAWALDEIERLREREQDLRMHAEQDACEIERLRAEMQQVRLDHITTLAELQEAADDIERLRAAGDALADSVDVALHNYSHEIYNTLPAWREARRG